MPSPSTIPERADSDGAGALVERAVEILKKPGLNVSVGSHYGAGSSGNLVREYICRRADLVAAAGGDGTVNPISRRLNRPSLVFRKLDATTRMPVL